MLRKVSSFLLSLVMAVCIMSISDMSFAAAEKILYVAPDGSDIASGSIGKPLASLAGAKEKAKRYSGGVTVCFREGTYTFDETVRFDSSDKKNVTYKAYDGEKVVFTGGVPYAGFSEGEINGVRAFYRSVGTDADFNVLFGNDGLLPRPRLPETGYFHVRSVSESDRLNPEQETDVFRSYGAMYADPDDLAGATPDNDTLVRILHYWKDEMITVTSYDSESGRLAFSRPLSMRVQEGDRYFLENVREALDSPGEWYLDRAGGILWYIPRQGETAENLTLWGSSLETLIDIDGADGITFERIIFRGNGFNIPGNNKEQDFSSQAAYDATPALSVRHCSAPVIRNCEFRDIGACAVFMGKGVNGAVVDSCVFNNLGAQAVYIRGVNEPDSPDASKNITVTNNLITSYGRTFFNAVGVLIIHANSVNVSHNEISDGYYTAISCGWIWGYGENVTYNCKITDNLIYNIGQGWLSDMGGIYTLGVQPGTVLSGNVIHDVAADPGQGGYGGWGIYPDEGSSKILIEKNLVYSCGNDSYHLHYGADNTVRNNIFALSSQSQVRVVSRYEEHKTADFTNNVILTDGAAPALSYLQAPEACAAEGNILWDMTRGRKLYVSTGAEEDAMPFCAAERAGLIGENMTADPGFKDAGAFDFTLGEDSFAVQNGFEAWDYNEAGTLSGSVIGIDTQGGMTAYNDGATHREPQGVRRVRAFFRGLFYTIRMFFVRIKTCFSQKEV
ncbi:MAG: right-handed parallel beta-helix repeat-containing protein [Clostridia bacterium]|nr:right-handed parallel beta-helix repeat-containing protein [Clostridia bacterium]